MLLTPVNRNHSPRLNNIFYFISLRLANRLHPRLPMRLVWLAGLLACGVLLAGSPEREINVNERYTVESVEIQGHAAADLSAGLRGELRRLVGEKLNPPMLDDLAQRIRRELHVREVTHRVLRGVQPEHVRVVFEVNGRPAKFEVAVPKFLYRSQEGFTGDLEGTVTVGAQAFSLGLVSDGDELPERYAGLRARYENQRLGNDRVRLRFEFDDYHEQWNAATRAAADGEFTSGVYRSRQNLEPMVMLLLARPLTLGVGASFERFQPESPAARTASANAMVTTLRYHHRLEGSNGNQQDWDAGYSLRAATSYLGSDFAYARHCASAGYAVSWGRNEIRDEVTAGAITGRAPLYERFVLGNGSLLRGWDKFELDPLGGNRLVHNSVEYRYRVFEIFYDSGAIWDQGQAPVLRHSVGVGVRQNGLCVALAFPVKEGHIEPVFMVGMNY
jgi:Omp85 superfamily domain